MKYRKLGNSDLMVSEICLGCMGFGEKGRWQHTWTIDEEKSREIIKKALDLGINFFDTAAVYANGNSEEIVGRALRDYARREDVVVATKFVPRTSEEIEQGISTADHIRNSLEQSLKHLGMDYVDLYIYHMWDYNADLYEVMKTLNELVQSGKVRYLGISNCYAWQLALANSLAWQEGFARFVSVQNHYNLIFREEEREMAAYCKEKNIAMVPYSSLAAGRLARHPGEMTKRMKEDFVADSKYGKTEEADRIIIDRVAEIAEKRNVTMTEVSLAWLLTRVTSCIAGATKLYQVEQAAKAPNLVLTEEEILYLEEPYIPHALVGVMATNTPENKDKKTDWSNVKKEDLKSSGNK